MEWRCPVSNRLRLLEPIAGRAKLLRAWSDDDTGVSAWELAFETGSLWLTLSPDIARGFSGEGQLLSHLASPEWESAVQRVRAELRWHVSLTQEGVAEGTGLAPDVVASALAALSARGLVGYDSAIQAYFHRELPFDLERVEQLQPRLIDARRIVADGALRWRIRNKGGGECLVKGTQVEHLVRLDEAGDRCTCKWFVRYQGERGPCKHILAARIAFGGDDA